VIRQRKVTEKGLCLGEERSACFLGDVVGNEEITIVLEIGDLLGCETNGR